jgi:hypothetical protein
MVDKINHLVYGGVFCARLKLSFFDYGFMASLSPERQQIAKVFKKHIEQAMAELGHVYKVFLQGTFDKTPIKIEIEVSAKDGIP